VKPTHTIRLSLSHSFLLSLCLCLCLMVSSSHTSQALNAVATSPALIADGVLTMRISLPDGLECTLVFHLATTEWRFAASRAPAAKPATLPSVGAEIPSSVGAESIVPPAGSGSRKRGAESAPLEAASKRPARETDSSILPGQAGPDSPDVEAKPSAASASVESGLPAIFTETPPCWERSGSLRVMGSVVAGCEAALARVLVRQCVAEAQHQHALFWRPPRALDPVAGDSADEEAE
jgi:hypothetical protein